MITSEEVRKIITNIINNNYKIMGNEMSKIIDFKNQQEKVNELLSAYRQLSRLEDKGIFLVEDYIQDEEDRNSAIDSIIDKLYELESELNDNK